MDDQGRQGSHRVRPRAEGRHGYAYTYRKTLRLDGDKLILEHELRNTGTKPIATSVYNHNFFTLDRKTTGPAIVVRFPFAPKAARPLNGMAEVRGREIAFARDSPAEGERLHRARGLRRHRRRTTASRWRTAPPAPASASTGDRPLSKLLFWSAVKTVCPEPYIDASVEPGRSTSWAITYAFYQAKK